VILIGEDEERRPCKFVSKTNLCLLKLSCWIKKNNRNAMNVKPDAATKL
jgi:hypothetical protein